MQEFDDVAAFHRAFGVPVLTGPHIPLDRAALRLRLLDEELDELRLAVAQNNLAGTLHELTDLRVVLYGAFLEFGLAPLAGRAWAEIHRANMSKLGADGRPMYRPDGKVLKGPAFRPADIRALFGGSAS